jgi:hypothetical protein
VVSTCEQARLARAQLLAEPGGLAAGQAWRVERWLRHWLEDARPYLRSSTWDGYRKHVERYLIPMLGHHTLAELTTRQVQASLRAIAARTAAGGGLIAAGTIVRIFATLRSGPVSGGTQRVHHHQPCRRRAATAPAFLHAAVDETPRA